MPNSIVEQQLIDIAVMDDYYVHIRFLPSAWLAANHSSRVWHSVAFPPTPRSLIPQAPGVYAFVVKTDIFDFHHANGLFYIGKATNLYERVAAYIAQIDKDLRETRINHIWKMVNRWNGYLTYFYTITANVEEAESLEAEMIKAFDPPFNKLIDAETRMFTKAFTP